MMQQHLDTGSAIHALRAQRGISRTEMCYKMGLDVSIMSYHFSYVTFTDRRK